MKELLEKKEEEVFDAIEYTDENRKLKVDMLSLFGILSIILIIIFIIVFSVFGFKNSKNTTIHKGVYIKNVDVSGLTKEQAIEKVNENIYSKLPENVLLRTEECETSISMEQIEVKFDVEEAVNLAYDIGRDGEFLENNLKVLSLLNRNVNIEPKLSVNEKILEYLLNDISTKLPNTVVESSYYIDDNNLVITKGKSGEVLKVDELKNTIINEISDLTYISGYIQMPTETKEPQNVDIDKIRSEIYREPQDAYYTSDPFEIHPQVNGVDFLPSIDEVKVGLENAVEEYIVPLNITEPNVKTKDIGIEAFPNLLSSFSTKYVASNVNRTNNLQLAASKIDGYVLMPGEEFSYNKVVGKRTIEAGYKDAAIYQDGKVVDGLGGGICQISSTLYNAVVFANLDIVERRNHQFIPSYVGGGRDATVVYGSIDFKFKNSRNYPIKILMSVSGGIAKAEIYGLAEKVEYKVDIVTRTTQALSYNVRYVSGTGKKSGTVIQGGAKGAKVEAYKVLYYNGEEVSRTLLSKDTYNAMDRIIAK